VVDLWDWNDLFVHIFKSLFDYVTNINENIMITLRNHDIYFHYTAGSLEMAFNR